MSPDDQTLAYGKDASTADGMPKANNSNSTSQSAVSKAFKSCILHIGTEKTGSSAVQNFFFLNKKRLKKEGIYYPSIGQSGSQWQFVAAVHDAPWSNVDIKREFDINDGNDQTLYAEKLNTQLQSEFRNAKNCHTLVLSSEHFHSRLHSQNSVARLKKLLDPWIDNFTVVVYFRRQDRVAISLNSTRVKSGSQAKIDVFPNFSRDSLPYYDYSRLFNRWAQVFGRESIVARKYENAVAQPGGLIGDITSIVGTTTLKKKVPQLDINASLSRPAFYFLKEMNKQLPKHREDGLDEDADQMIKDLSHLFPGKHFPVEREKAVRFMSQFEDVNEELRQLAFPNHPAPLFDTDFNEYPERPEVSGLTVEEAVEISINLAKYRRQRQSETTFLDMLWQILAPRK